MTFHRKITLGLFFIFLVLIVLAFFAHSTSYFPLDLIITQLFQQTRSPFADAFWGAISWPGYPPQVNVLVPIVVLFLFIKGWKKEAAMEILAAILTTVIGYSFKIGVNRFRPSEHLVNVIHKGLEGGKYSFPAGHVESFMGFLGFLGIIFFVKIKNPLLKKIIVVLIVIYLILLGPSRIYMGEHWFSDVIGAYLVGFLVLGILIIIYSKLLNYGQKNR